MTGTETELAQQWGTWLSDKLRRKKWSGADLRRAFEAVGGKVGPSQVSRWINGEQRPSVKSAGIIADALGLDRREVWTAAGRMDEVRADEGPVVVVDDPAEAFVRQIKARRFPPAVEERLIAEIRAEIEQRLARQKDALDTVELAISEPRAAG